MLLGMVGQPIPHQWFDSKVLLERVSEEVEVNMPTTHQNFSDDRLINGAIKRGERVDLFTRSTSLTWSNIVKDIATFYDTDDAISDRLKLNLTMYIYDNGNMK